MNLHTALRLGRVSNLPTVWTNTAAGAVLSGATAEPILLALAALACSLFYVGGMFLNDYYDREFDAVHQPERPIPCGDADAFEVAVGGYSMLAAGTLLLASCAVLADASVLRALSAAALLAAAVVAYDRKHKENPLAPLLMAACRVLVYVCAAAALAGAFDIALGAGAALAGCYIIGLSHAARLEQGIGAASIWPLAFLLAAPVALGASTWFGPTPVATLGFAALLTAASFYAVVLMRGGGIGNAVATLIAGIALLDAGLIAAAGSPMTAAATALGFPLTLALQRLVRGT